MPDLVKSAAETNVQRSVRVATGARLHFGLLDTAPPFGGVGVMVEAPATELKATVGERCIAERSVKQRLVPLAERIAATCGTDIDSLGLRLRVLREPPRHSGFGSGTQWSLAASEAIARLVGCHLEPLDLAGRVAQRGKRSAVGIHGYFQGGLIHESASCDEAAGGSAAASPPSINPLRDRVPLPSSWRVALFLPSVATGSVSGEIETEHFTRLAPASPGERAALHRLIRERMLPAARRADFEEFASAVGEYNRRSGMLFAPVQGGPYRGRVVSEVVQFLRDRGARGIGQSSWGPGVFAWFDDASSAERFCHDQLRDQPLSVTLTAVRNESRRVTVTERHADRGTVR